MKVKLSTNDKDFKPITLILTIESKHELGDLLARLNAGHDAVNSGNTYNFADPDSCEDFFQVIEKLYHDIEYGVI